MGILNTIQYTVIGALILRTGVMLINWSALSLVVTDYLDEVPIEIAIRLEQFYETCRYFYTRLYLGFLDAWAAYGPQIMAEFNELLQRQPPLFSRIGTWLRYSYYAVYNIKAAVTKFLLYSFGDNGATLGSLILDILIVVAVNCMLRHTSKLVKLIFMTFTYLIYAFYVGLSSIITAPYKLVRILFHLFV